MTDVDAGAGGGDDHDASAPDPAGTGLAPTPLEVLDLSPEVWRIVAVAGVEMELPSANPEVVLHEAQDPWRELRIPVGMAEGTAIAFAFRGIDTPRPLTHELVTEILDRHDVSIEAVRITVRRGQVFFAEIDTMGPRGGGSSRAAPPMPSPWPCASGCPPRSWWPNGCSPVPTPRPGWSQKARHRPEVAPDGAGQDGIARGWGAVSGRRPAPRARRPVPPVGRWPGRPRWRARPRRRSA